MIFSMEFRDPGTRNRGGDASVMEKVLGSALIVVGIILWILAKEFFYSVIVPNSSLLVIQTVLAASALSLGLVLYFIRCRARGCYGFLECVVGISGAVAVAGLFSNDPEKVRIATTIFSWVGCVYVIVRGLDNLYEALKRKSSGKEKGTMLVLWERFFFGETVVVPQGGVERGAN